MAINETAHQQSEELRVMLAMALIGLVTSPKYDPTVEQAALMHHVETSIKHPKFTVLTQLTELAHTIQTGRPSGRDYAEEVRALVRNLFPIGSSSEIDGQQDPGEGVGSDDHIDGEPGNDKVDRVERIVGKHPSLEMPYGRELEELNELIASIEKTEGRSLTAVETRDVNRLFNTAIETGQPQTLKLDPSKAGGYLIMAAKPEDASGKDLLEFIAALGLLARK